MQVRFEAHFLAKCMDDYGLTTQYHWAIDFFGGKNITVDFMHASNIVWTNGDLDPWKAGGVLKNVSDDTLALVIPKAAHHLDLRTPDPQDPPEVTWARGKISETIGKWVEEYKA